MAEEEKKANKGAKAPEAEAKAPGSGKKAAVIAAVLVVDLAVMAGLAYFIVGRIQGAEAKEAKELQEAEEKEKKELTHMGTVLAAPMELTVNIGGPGEDHYLKCAVQLEWDGTAHPHLGEEITRRMPKIIDMVINILSGQTYEEMLKPSGKQRIRETIVADVNAILPPDLGGVRNAYFTEFLVQ